MKKIICSILAILTVCYTLCGCYVNETAEIDVNRSGKGTISCIFELDEEMLNKANMQQLHEPWSAFEKKEKRGEVCYYATYELKVSSWEDLEEKLKEMTYGVDGNIKVFSEVYVTNKYIELKTNPAYKNQADMASFNSIYDFILILDMPFKITDYSTGELSNGGKTLTVTVTDPSYEQDISLQLNYQPLWASALTTVLTILIILSPFIIFLAIIAAVVILLIIITKKKKRTSPSKPLAEQKKTNQINDEERNNKNEDQQP